VAGPNYTILDYITDSGFVETPLTRDDPAAPAIILPVPAEWQEIEEVAATSFGGVTYPATAFPDNPPRIQAILSRITGPVDPALVLEYAPGELQNLPGWQPASEGDRATFAGYDAFQLLGFYDDAGVVTAVAQETVVIPTPEGDGVFILQLNGPTRLSSANNAAAAGFAAAAPFHTTGDVDTWGHTGNRF
jgi:hypothetical protein